MGRARQVWRALCRPLGHDIAVKVIELERQDVDLVRCRVVLLGFRLRQGRSGAFRAPGLTAVDPAGTHGPGRQAVPACSSALVHSK